MPEKTNTHSASASLNADFRQQPIVESNTLPWRSSSQKSLKRRMLERDAPLAQYNFGGAELFMVSGSLSFNGKKSGSRSWQGFPSALTGKFQTDFGIEYWINRGLMQQ